MHLFKRLFHLHSPEHILNADLVRVLALFGVVGIHLLNPIYARPDFFGGKFWWICFVLNSLFRASVPLFVMLSGYLLLGKKTTVRENMVRTWRRIVLPLLSFYVLVNVVRIVITASRGKEFDFNSLLSNLNTASGSYLYFLVIILFLYLLIPVLQLVFEQHDQLLPKYVIGLFFANAVLATMARYFSLRAGDIFNTYTIWVMWIGYFMLGYWIRLNLENFGRYRKQCIAVFAIGLMVTLGAGYWSWQQHWLGNDAMYISGVTYPEEYLSVNVVIMAVSTFVLLMTAKLPKWLRDEAPAASLLPKLAGLSFGVYLFHVLIMDLLNNFAGVTADSPYMPNLFAYVLINSILTVGLSLVVSAITNKTRFFRWLVGK